jgi:hypothetical protein
LENLAHRRLSVDFEEMEMVASTWAYIERIIEFLKAA